jgi:hypothetical protein
LAVFGLVAGPEPVLASDVHFLSGLVAIGEESWPERSPLPAVPPDDADDENSGLPEGWEEEADSDEEGSKRATAHFSSGLRFQRSFAGVHSAAELTVRPFAGVSRSPILRC